MFQLFFLSLSRDRQCACFECVKKQSVSTVRNAISVKRAQAHIHTALHNYNSVHSSIESLSMLLISVYIHIFFHPLSFYSAFFPTSSSSYIVKCECICADHNYTAPCNPFRHVIKHLMNKCTGLTAKSSCPMRIMGKCSALI